MCRGGLCHQGCPGKVQLRKREYRNHRGPDQQDYRLQDIGIDHRGQPAGCRVESCNGSQQQRGAEQVQPRHEHCKHDGAGKQRTRGVHHDIRDNGQQGKIATHMPVIAVFKKLRDRANACIQIQRHQKQREHHQDRGRHPFVVRNGDTPRIGRAGQADHGGTGDVRGKQRQANRQPAQPPPGQKQVLGAVGTPRHAKTDGKHQQEVAGNDHRSIVLSVKSCMVTDRPRLMEQK